MTPRNARLFESWFAVAQSQHVKTSPLGVTVLGQAIVIARVESGNVFALEDCCPHRLVPLSQGKVTNDGLQCRYHGWTFGVDGHCTAVPGLAPDTCLPRVRVKSILTKEHDGFIWVRLASSCDSEGVAFPPFLSRLSEQSRRFEWQSTWRAGATDILENFLDPLHTHFIHSSLVRRNGTRNVVNVNVKKINGLLQIDYEGQPQQSGLLYRLFESPRILERAHFAASMAGSAQLEYRYQNGSALYFTLHCTPVSESQTVVHGSLHVEGRWAPRWAVSLLVWPFLRKVAKQDQQIVEAQAGNKRRFRRRAGVSTDLDFVRPYLDEAWSPDAPAAADDNVVVKVYL